MPTKEQILEAAATSPEAKQHPYALSLRINNHDLLVAYKDCQKFPGILLSDYYNWEIVEGKYLTPTKK